MRKLMAGQPYFEAYVKCSLEVCAKRDPKGLYKKAIQGEIINMTGISDPYEEPEHPDLTIETDKLGLQQSVDEVIRFLLKQGLIGTAFQPQFDEHKFSNAEQN